MSRLATTRSQCDDSALRHSVDHSVRRRAAARGNLLPLPGSLRGGAAGKVVIALLTRGLISEQMIDSLAKADAAPNTVWRNEDDGRAVLLLITRAGLEAIGVAGIDQEVTDADDLRCRRRPGTQGG
jgi:hypothetical protein